MSQGKYRFYSSRAYGPLLWVLVPMVVGYVLGGNAWWLVGVLGLGICCFRMNRMLLVLSVVSVASGYYGYRQEGVYEWGHMPEREVEVVLRVEQPYGFRGEGRGGGIGRIIGVPEHLGYLGGQRVSYFVSKMEEGYNIRSSELVVSGVIRGVGGDEGEGFERYLRSQGIRLQLSRGWVVRQRREANVFYGFCYGAQGWLEGVLRAGFGGDGVRAGTYVGMLLGSKGALGVEQKEVFKRTGSLHLFAISGLHVGVIGLTLGYLLKLLRVRGLWAAGIGLMVLYLYVQVTGGAASAMRAFMLVAFYWGGRVFLRKKEGFSALLGSAVIVLVWEPMELWSIGFQLSYLIVGSILLYGVPLMENMSWYLGGRYDVPGNVYFYYKKRLLSFLLGLLVISLGANLLSIPLSMYYFGIYAPGGVLLSLVLMPLASVVIIVGFISLLVGLMGLVWVSALLNEFAYGVLGVMEVCIVGSLRVVGLFRETEGISGVLALLVCGVTLCFLIYGHRRGYLGRKGFYVLPVLWVGVMSYMLA